MVKIQVAIIILSLVLLSAASYTTYTIILEQERIGNITFSLQSSLESLIPDAVVPTFQQTKPLRPMKDLTLFYEDVKGLFLFFEDVKLFLTGTF